VPTTQTTRLPLCPRRSRPVSTVSHDVTARHHHANDDTTRHHCAHVPSTCHFGCADRCPDFFHASDGGSDGWIVSGHGGV
jgi:hypothetical protein